MVRGIQHYHRNVLGWNDIGYNFLVDRHGQVFEGRSGGIEGAVIGAHAQGFNSVSSGVASLGTHTATGAEAAALEAFAALIAWKLSLHGVPTEGEATVVSLGGGDKSLPGRPAGAGPTDRWTPAHERDSLSRRRPVRPAPGASRARRRAHRGRGRSEPERFGAAGHIRRAAWPSGQLLLGDGTAGGGREVELETRRKRAWRTLARTVTAVDGTWSATVLPEHSGRLRARFRGDQTPGGAQVDPDADRGPLEGHRRGLERAGPGRRAGGGPGWHSSPRRPSSAWRSSWSASAAATTSESTASTRSPATADSRRESRFGRRVATESGSGRSATRSTPRRAPFVSRSSRGGNDRTGALARLGPGSSRFPPALSVRR